MKDTSLGSRNYTVGIGAQEEMGSHHDRSLFLSCC